MVYERRREEKKRTQEEQNPLRLSWGTSQPRLRRLIEDKKSAFCEKSQIPNEVRKTHQHVVQEKRECLSTLLEETQRKTPPQRATRFRVCRVSHTRTHTHIRARAEEEEKGKRAFNSTGDDPLGAPKRARRRAARRQVALLRGQINLVQVVPDVLVREHDALRIARRPRTVLTRNT